jgi:hypothetical protein
MHAALKCVLCDTHGTVEFVEERARGCDVSGVFVTNSGRRH